MTKPKTDLGIVGVLMGGCSSEREISLKSGRAVVEALKSLGCAVKPLDINTPDEQKNTGLIRTANVDVAFVVLHGTFGEDGRIQSLLDNLDIPFAPIEMQQKFADLVQKVEKLKEKQKQSEIQLTNLFNSLMQRAFRGELL